MDTQSAINLMLNLHTDLSSWITSKQQVINNIQEMAEYARNSIGPAFNDAMGKIAADLDKTVQSQYKIHENNDTKTKVRLSNLTNIWSDLYKQVAEGSVNIAQLSKNELENITKLDNALENAMLTGMDLNDVNDQRIRDSMDLHKQYTKLNDVTDINNKRIENASKLLKFFGINVNENVVSGMKKVANGMPGTTKLIDSLGLGSNKTMKSLAGFADKGLMGVSTGGLICTAALITLAVAAVALIVVWKLLSAGWSIVVKNAEEYRMANYRAIGSINDLVSSTFDLVGAYGLSAEASVQIIKSMGHAGFTLKSFSGNIDNSKKLLMDHIKVNTKFSQATGVSAESTAKFMKVLSVINGTSSSGLRKTDILLGSITTSMRLYGLEAKDVEGIIGYMTNNAIRMNEIFGSRAVPKMSQYLIDLAARAKSVGVSFDGIQSKMGEIIENPIDNILLLGKSAFRGIEERMEALMEKSVSVYARMKAAASGPNGPFAVSILEGIYKIKMEQLKVIADEKEAWDKLSLKERAIKRQQIKDQEAVTKAWEESMGTFNKSWDRMVGPITKFSSDIAMPIVKVVTWLINIINDGAALIADGFNTIWKNLDGIMGGATELNKWKKVLIELGIELEPIGFDIKEIGKAIAYAFGAGIAAGLYLISFLLRQVARLIVGVLQAWTWLSKKLDGIPYIGKILSGLISPFIAIKKFIIELKGLMFGSSFLHIYESIIEFTKPALSMLYGAINYLLNPIKTVKSFFMSLWDSIKTGISSVVSSIKSFIDKPLTSMEEKLKKIRDLAVDTWEYVLPTLPGGGMISAGLAINNAMVNNDAAKTASIKIPVNDLANFSKLGEAVSSAIKDADFSKINVSSKITVSPNGTVEISDKSNNKASTIATKSRVNTPESPSNNELVDSIKLIATLVGKIADNPASTDDIKKLLSSILNATEKDNLLGSITNNKSLTWKV